jgi:hypothetical protein
MDELSNNSLFKPSAIQTPQKKGQKIKISFEDFEV